MSQDLIRCPWPGTDPLYVDYHDNVWGKPEYDDNALFAKLILDGFQAGLSWITILKKEKNFYEAFDGLDPVKMAEYDQKKIDSLLENAGIIRNKQKVNAAVSNARAFLEIKAKESFSDFIWQFTDGKVKKNKFSDISQVPANSTESDLMSKELKKRGFKFCGSTICYAFMQAVGMVNDHLTTCFCYSKYN